MSLEVATASGPILGFADTFPLRDRSSAEEVHSGADGGRDAVWKWLGVPYAQAKRWERPSPPDPWKEPLKAWEFGTQFPQKENAIEKMWAEAEGWIKRDWIGQSEDSHFVNVFAPEGVKEGDDLPVLVWVYGGSFSIGSSERFYYDPTEWIRRSVADGQKFIVVTGNYRTNIFGFFSTPDLAAEDPEGLCGNYGAYDVVAMFEWVQTNIHAFGGSPTNVTAFGESAGGLLISTLLCSRNRLFRRAIIQSGAPGTSLPTSSLCTSRTLVLVG
ncbi:carboxylesterase type B [Pseudohyphozyma bogoriensis]|nr:carboxylesterase type B [Pseudohyphozyma bogoriensis]